jgi:hypothetical protein
MREYSSATIRFAIGHGRPFPQRLLPDKPRQLSRRGAERTQATVVTENLVNELFKWKAVRQEPFRENPHSAETVGERFCVLSYCFMVLREAENTPAHSGVPRNLRSQLLGDALVAMVQPTDFRVSNHSTDRLY